METQKKIKINNKQARGKAAALLQIMMRNMRILEMNRAVRRA